MTEPLDIDGLIERKRSTALINNNEKLHGENIMSPGQVLMSHHD